ncbi:tail component of prophage [Escherichia coli]|uniref:Tail component of prophage n=1 Tax=Escherichia coli TaxID=562 RepID=A0A377ECU2_ECOLX|nr:tail component of prophage [Escherichia coli]
MPVRFDEQMSRVRRHFSGLETDARKTAGVVEQNLSRQALAAQKAGISVGQYKAAMRTLPAQFTDIATQLARWSESLADPAATGRSGEGLLRRDDPHVQGACPVRSPCRWSGSPRWRWRQVRWCTPGTREIPRFQRLIKTLVLSGNQSRTDCRSPC